MHKMSMNKVSDPEGCATYILAMGTCIDFPGIGIKPGGGVLPYLT